VKGFYRDISSKRTPRENASPLMNGEGDLLMNEMKKAEALNVFFTLVFSGRTCLQESQAPEASGTFWNKEDLPISRG